MRIFLLMTLMLVGITGDLRAQNDRDDATLYRAGQWEVYIAGVRTGEPLCGMSITDPRDGRSLHFKWSVGNAHMNVVAFRTTWNIPRNTDIAIQLSIDGYVWNATAGAISLGNGISFRINRNEIDNWERRFRLGNHMRLAFPNGTEVTWGMSLVGTNAAMTAFVGCMRALNDRFGSGATQPHSRAPAGPTQPHGRPQSAPTQQPTTPVGPAPGATERRT